MIENLPQKSGEIAPCRVLIAQVVVGYTANVLRIGSNIPSFVFLFQSGTASRFSFSLTHIVQSPPMFGFCFFFGADSTRDYSSFSLKPISA
jgi:hypothetical protein